MDHSDFDLLIIGAGPAGATLALRLASGGLRIGVAEKEVTPGSKICGDALGGSVFNVMRRLPGDIYSDFLASVPHLPSHGIRFTAPGHRFADIPFSRHEQSDAPPPGCLCARSDFDRFLTGKLETTPGITLMRGVNVKQVSHTKDGIAAETSTGTITAAMVAGADGAHSVVRRSFLSGKLSPSHVSVGIRAYFQQVEVHTPGHHIELIFLKSILPGYFWIFPMPGGGVNAGFGMMQEKILREKINLTALLDDLIRNDPYLAPRFRNATMTGKPGAHILPLGSTTPPRSGQRFILLGDAASLVDPFSGEGIGNAMASAETAARVLTGCFQRNDFSAAALLEYDRNINNRFSRELRTSATMQHLARKAWLLNFVIGKASRNAALRHLFTAMYTNESMREKLRNPSFYARLLFK